MIEIETRCGLPWFISLIHSAGQFIADCHLFGNQNKQLPLVSQFRHQTILLSKHAIQLPTGGKEPNLHVYQEGKMLQLCPYIGAHRGHFCNNIEIKTNNCRKPSLWQSKQTIAACKPIQTPDNLAIKTCNTASFRIQKA